MKICCGIVLYNPNFEDIDNVNYYSELFKQVIVFNNSDNNTISFEKNNIITIHKYENLGLSIALDELCQCAKKYNYDFIMLFDQDSRMDKIDIMNMIDYINENDHSDVAIFCPKIQYEHIKSKQRRVQGVTEVDWCITSGSILRVSIYGKNASFDRNYFIDRLDKDYCRQIRNVGLRIVQCDFSLLKQSLGDMITIGNLNLSNHTPIRHYYISRNRLYYNRKFGISKSICILQILRHFSIILFFESDKKKKTGYFIRGLIDYKRNKFGKLG